MNMKFTNLLCKLSPLILRRRDATHTRVCSVPGQKQMKREFSVSQCFQCNEMEDFEFEAAPVDVPALTGGDPDKSLVLTRLIAEVKFLHQIGAYVPSNLRTEDWQELLKMESKKERKIFYKCLYLKQVKKYHDKLARADRTRGLMEARKERPDRNDIKLTTNSPLNYSLTFNSIFLRIRDTSIKRIYNYQLMKAEMFGPHLVIDCSYESEMRPPELHHCAFQLVYGISSNRESINPFHIIHCNFDVNGQLMKKIRSVMGNTEDQSVFKYTDKSYLDLYPADKLVYLSPHSDYEMEKYEPDCIYIIGAFVDEVVHDPLSMVKAKRDGLRTAKFPIDKYLHWCQGSQFLPLNQCMNIMTDLKNGRSWEEAFRHIARRKLRFSLRTCKNELNNKFIKEMYNRTPRYRRTLDNLNDTNKIENKSPG